MSPTTRRAQLLVCASFVSSLEVGAALRWATRPGDVFAMSVHVLAVCACGVAAWLALGPRPRRWLAAFLIACVPLLIPLIGAFALVWLLIATRSVRPDSARLRTAVRIPPLPSHPTGLERGRIAGDPLAALRFARTAERRVQALLATRGWPDAAAQPVLSAALSDPADEVRLLAYALLQAREQAVCNRIAASRKALDAAGASPDPHLLRVLALQHWELIDGGLAEGAVRSRTIEAALHYTEEALARAPEDGVLHLVHAKLFLECGQVGGAVVALKAALATGLPPRSVAADTARVDEAQRAAARLRRREEVLAGRRELEGLRREAVGDRRRSDRRDARSVHPPHGVGSGA